MLSNVPRYGMNLEMKLKNIFFVPNNRLSWLSWSKKYLLEVEDDLRNKLASAELGHRFNVPEAVTWWWIWELEAVEAPAAADLRVNVEELRATWSEPMGWCLLLREPQLAEPQLELAEVFVWMTQPPREAMATASCPPPPSWCCCCWRYSRCCSQPEKKKMQTNRLHIL